MGKQSGLVIRNGVLREYSGTDVEVIVPSGVRIIGRAAFAENRTIERVVLGEDVQEICGRAFAGCTNLQSVQLPKILQVIREHAFENCTTLEEIALPAWMAGMEEGVFDGCASLQKVSLPLVLEDLPAESFQNCTSLEEIDLPAGLERIGYFAFAECTSLRRVGMPSVVPKVDTKTSFYGCTALEEFTLAGQGKLNAEGGVLFGDQGKRLVLYPAGRRGIYRVPDGVEAIGPSAFAHCEELTGIILPESLRSIGEQAFEDCGKLKEVLVLGRELTMEESAFHHADQIVFLSEHLDLSELPDKEMVRRTILYLLEKMKNEEPMSAAMKENFHRNVCACCKDLYPCAMGEEMGLCRYMLEEKCIPAEDIPLLLGEAEAEVKTMLLSYQDTLITPAERQQQEEQKEELLLTGNMPEELARSEWKWAKIPQGVRLVQYIGRADVLVIPDRIDGRPVREIGRRACSPEAREASRMDLEVRRKIVSVILPESVTVIGEGAFENCEVLHQVLLPVNLQKIGNSAFRKCGALETVDLPENLCSLGAKAFEQCVKLKKICLPEKITELKKDTFQHCWALEEVLLPEQLRTIGARAFADCRKLEQIDLPSRVKKIGEKAFALSDLRSIRIPEHVTVIEKGTFGMCEHLQKVFLPEVLRELEDGAFGGCTLLAKLRLPARLEEIGDIVFACDDILTLEVTEGTPAHDYAADHQISYCVVKARR